MAPTITRIVASPAAGSLNAGKTVTLSVEFSEEVTVTEDGGGAPSVTLQLDSRAQATYVSGSGTKTLVFTYTVAAHEDTADLTVVGVNLASSSIRSASGVDAELPSAPINPAGTLVIDTTAPDLWISLASDTGWDPSDLWTSSAVVKGGGDGNAVVHFIIDGKAVSTTAKANLGGAWTFNPTGLAQGRHTIVATETDAAGNTASSEIEFTLDTVRPTVTSISTTASSSTVVVGQTVTIDVTTSEECFGTPTLKLNNGGTAELDSSFFSEPGKFRFIYTVGAGQSTADLRIAAFLFGSPATGSCTDAAGNAIDWRTISNADLKIKVDTAAPKVVAVSATTSNGSTTALAGETITITLTMSEAVTVSGIPALTLNNGGKAVFSTIDTAHKVLTFTYTVDRESTTGLKIVGLETSLGTIVNTAHGNPPTSVSADLKLQTNAYTWIHGDSGTWDWATAAYWTPAGGPPGTASANDIALVTAAGTYTVTDSADRKLAVLNTAAKATVEVVGHRLDLTRGTGSGANAGTIALDSGAVLAIGGLFRNTGSINSSSNSTGVSIEILSDTTLSGGGKVVLSDSASNAISVSAGYCSLTNNDNTISGAGSIGQGSGSFTLINKANGIINANAATNTLTLVHGINVFNEGVIEGTTAAGLTIETDITNIRLLEALGTNAKVVIRNAQVTNTGGTILASGSGAHVDIEDATIHGGTLATAGASAHIDVFGASTLANLTNTTTINIIDGASVVLAETIKNKGTLAVTSKGSTTLLKVGGGSSQLEGGGRIVLSDDAHNAVDATGGDAHLINIDNLISGAGSIGTNSFADHLTIDNRPKGIIDASGENALQIGAIAIYNDGTLRSTGHGGLVLSGTEIHAQDTGQLTAMTGSHIDLVHALIVGGTVSTAAQASIAALNGGDSRIEAKVSNSGTLAARGGDLTVSGAIVNSGVLSAEDSKLALEGKVTGTGKATIEGTGSIEFQAANSTANVVFKNGASGSLILDASTSFKGTISGFSPAADTDSGPNIDLADISYSVGSSITNATFAGTHSSGTLTVTDGTKVTKLNFAGDYTAAEFIASADGHGGTSLIQTGPRDFAVSDIAGSHLLDAHYNGAILAGTSSNVVNFTLTKAVSLTGDAGGVLLGNADVIRTNGVAQTLTNRELIHGSGKIGDALLTLDNTASGVIKADNGRKALVIETTGHTVTNAGTIEARDGSVLLISHTTITDTATAHVSSLGSNSKLNVDAATINGGIVTIGAGAALAAVNGSTSTLNAAVDNSGRLAVADGSHLIVKKALSGQGTVEINGNSFLELGAGCTNEIDFLGINATLQLDTFGTSAVDSLGLVAGFVAGCDIDFAAITYTVGAGQLSYVANASNTGGVLSVSDGTHKASLTLRGDYTAASFSVVEDARHHVDLRVV